MSKLTFTTNINCSGCEAKITPALNNAGGIKKWKVNTADPAKLLEVETNGLESGQVIEIINNAGFQARLVK